MCELEQVSQDCDDIFCCISMQNCFFLSFRLIPKKLMSSYTGMEECRKKNTTTKRKM